ncbi:MAG: hypothetical protein LBD25_06060 [Coriobacteriales bacterium]|jgi:hypothetical protein|nr:hypothetical protein [Coriobacteriales bacterium]
MPALFTHHHFGLAVLVRRGAASFATRVERDAFLLGNQGPDPFFYALRTPALIASKRFGSRLHRDKPDAVFDTMSAVLAELDATSADSGLPARAQSAATSLRHVLEAYACGYLCHFTLDSTAHPLVYYYQDALCNAGVPGLGIDDEMFVHAQIEADLDAMLLWRLTGKTVADFKITRYLLQGGDVVLKQIDSLFARVARDVYGEVLPSGAYCRAVKDMRATVNIMQSATGRKRAVLGVIERLVPGRRHSLLQAMSHRTDVKDDCPFWNEGREPWTRPATGEEITASFLDLFESAANSANHKIDEFMDGASGARLTGGLDFQGMPIL